MYREKKLRINDNKPRHIKNNYHFSIIIIQYIILILIILSFSIYFFAGTENITELSNSIESQNNNEIYITSNQMDINSEEDIIQVGTRAITNNTDDNSTTNEPPDIFPIPKQTVHETKHTLIDLEDYVYDPDNNMSELEISVDSDYVVVTGHSLAFLGVSELPENVTLTVSDGYNNITEVIEIEFKEKEQPKPPSIWNILVNYICIGVILIILILAMVGIRYYNKSQYYIDELFLIHKSGTLINNLISHRKQTNVDDIIFSGMFTAVQDYIAHTFEKARTGEGGVCGTGKHNDCVLDELQLGDKKILIERSDNAYLAVIFTGDGIPRLRKRVKKILNEIESKYEDVLPTWEGEIKALIGTKEILNTLIKNRNKNNTAKGSGSNIKKTQPKKSRKQSISKPNPRRINTKPSSGNRANLKPPNGEPINPSWKVKVKMSDDGSEVEFDTSKSLFEQLMALDEKSKKE
jgi:hypothetical protein